MPGCLESLGIRVCAPQDIVEAAANLNGRPQQWFSSMLVMLAGVLLTQPPVFVKLANKCGELPACAGRFRLVARPVPAISALFCKTQRSLTPPAVTHEDLFSSAMRIYQSRKLQSSGIWCKRPIAHRRQDFACLHSVALRALLLDWSYSSASRQGAQHDPGQS